MDKFGGKMPLDDEIISHNSDGSMNEDYCKWCFADGTYTYSDMDDLINICVKHMVGAYVNLAYPLPSGVDVKFLNDQTTYLGNQLECEVGGDRCFGVLAGMDFIMVSTYEAEGKNPELVLYKKR